MSWTIYTPEQLSNEAYQEHPAISGSGLATIYKQSPAHFKYSEQKESKALTFGIAAHAILLEPDHFTAQFVRNIDADQYPDALVGAKDMQAWLKERGLKVFGTKPELIERILDAEPETHILDVLVEQFASEHEGKTIMPPADFDKVHLMRDAIHTDKTMSAMLTGGYAEYSMIGELMGVEVKTRPDLITSAGGIVQYKTTRSCHPDDFGRNVDSYGYLLKAALEWSCFTQAYGQEPAYYIFLAQEKEAPYVWKPYAIDSDALAIGRVQLESALAYYERCLKSDTWTAYGSDIENLILPEWLKKQYGVS